MDNLVLEIIMFTDVTKVPNHISSTRSTLPIKSTHYSLGLDPAAMNKWAEEAAETLYFITEGKVLNLALVGMGFSGSAHMVALAQAYYNLYNISLQCVYIRKNEEKKHHGAEIEHSMAYPSQIKTFVFVDDLISTGTTFFSAYYKMKTWLTVQYNQDYVESRWIAMFWYSWNRKIEHLEEQWVPF
jgi:hypothetical protein